MSKPERAFILEASSHLGAALSQVLPSDDQVIVGHMRSAHALLVGLLNAVPEGERLTTEPETRETP